MKFCVIGIGHFGYEVATTLTENGIEVLAVDLNENRIEKIRDKVAQAICINIIDEGSLRTIGIEEMDGVIIGFGKNFADTATITRILKQEFEHPLVIARTNSAIKADILNLVGADRVIRPEYYSAIRLADNLSSAFPSSIRYADGCAVVQLSAPAQFVNRTIADLELLEKYQVHCIGLERDQAVITAQPTSVLQEHDILLLAGKNSDLKKLADL